MSEIETSADTSNDFEAAPTSDESNIQSDNTFDNDSYEQVEEPRESDTERLLRERVGEQERVIRLLQETSRRPEPERPREPEFDPEDLATYGGTDSLIERKLEAIRAEQQQFRINSIVQQARHKYPDYDKVAELGKELVGNNTAMAKAIMTSDNPAELIYTLGKGNPRYNQPAKVENNVGKIKKNLGKPNTLNQAGGGSPSSEVDYASMSKAEFEAKKRKVMFGL